MATQQILAQVQKIEVTFASDVVSWKTKFIKWILKITSYIHGHEVVIVNEVKAAIAAKLKADKDAAVGELLDLEQHLKGVGVELSKDQQDLIDSLKARVNSFEGEVKTVAENVKAEVIETFEQKKTALLTNLTDIKNSLGIDADVHAIAALAVLEERINIATAFITANQTKLQAK